MESSTIQSQAAIIREFVAHPGMKLLVDALQNRVKGSENAWLNAKTAEEAEVLRQSARCYAALMGTLNGFLVKAKADEANSK